MTGFRLELDGLERHYRAADGGFRLVVPALRIEQGARISVLGDSGTGKSTLLDLLAFLAPPSACARFTLQADAADHDLRGAWNDGRRGLLARLRARHLGYILQTGGLLPYLSLRENALLSRRLLGLPGPGPVDRLARELGLAEVMARIPEHVSVGQRQRAAVIRAMAHEPSLILADEPTAALDRDRAFTLIDLLVRATTERGTALVLVSHDPDIAARVCGQVVRCRAVSGTVPATSIVEP